MFLGHISSFLKLYSQIREQRLKILKKLFYKSVFEPRGFPYSRPVHYHLWAHLQTWGGDTGYPDQIQTLVAEFTDPLKP